MGEIIQFVSLINHLLVFCKHNSLLPYLAMFADSLDIILKQISCHLLNTHHNCLFYGCFKKNKHSPLTNQHTLCLSGNDNKTKANGEYLMKQET